MDNKRKHPRHKISDVGKIMISKPFSVLDCVVHDLSEGGASLEVSGKTELPPSFELVFGGQRLRCTVVWQQGRKIGVSFV